jgi:hypothetical protein
VCTFGYKNRTRLRFQDDIPSSIHSLSIFLSLRCLWHKKCCDLFWRGISPPDREVKSRIRSSGVDSSTVRLGGLLPAQESP